MSHDLARLRRANSILATSDYGPISPRPDGSHARYQFFFSEDLWTATPLTDSDGNPRYEYLCHCGVDKQIHAPDCTGLTLAAVKFIPIKVDPTLHNVFVLCTWLPPPSEQAWGDLYGSFRYYPSEGRYVPISMNGHTVKLPYPPFDDVARRIAVAIKDYFMNKESREAEFDKMVELREGQKTRDYTPPQNSKFINNRNRLKDAMTLNAHKPGTRGSVSYQTVSGIPILSRPNPLVESQLPSFPDYSAPVAERPLIEVAQ